ncbi:MAG: hypothetical protein ABMB14_25315 [Myxococcota bacterium]
MRARTTGLTAPKNATFGIAVALGLLGVLLHYQVFTIAALAPYPFAMVALGLAVLAAGCTFRGL